MTENNYDCAAREIAQLMEEAREKDAEIENIGNTLGLVMESRDKTEIENAHLYKEIERLNSENKITISVCNENTDLKRMIIELREDLAIQIKQVELWEVVTKKKDAEIYQLTAENENLYLMVDLTESRCKELLEDITRIRRKIQYEATNDRH